MFSESSPPMGISKEWEEGFHSTCMFHTYSNRSMDFCSFDSAHRYGSSLSFSQFQNHESTGLGDHLRVLDTQLRTMSHDVPHSNVKGRLSDKYLYTYVSSFHMLLTSLSSIWNEQSPASNPGLDLLSPYQLMSVLQMYVLMYLKLLDICSYSFYQHERMIKLVLLRESWTTAHMFFSPLAGNFLPSVIPCTRQGNVTGGNTVDGK